MRYFLHIAIGLNQLTTTLVGGWPDETLSSYAWRLDQSGKRGGRVFRPLIDWLFSWQNHTNGHCFAAMQEERRRLQLPPALRTIS